MGETALNRGGHYTVSWSPPHGWATLVGPGVSQDHASSYPARLIDLLSAVTALLYPQHGGNWDGIVLADALVKSSAKERAAPAELARTFRGCKQALMVLQAWGR